MSRLPCPGNSSPVPKNARCTSLIPTPKRLPPLTEAEHPPPFQKNPSDDCVGLSRRPSGSCSRGPPSTGVWDPEIACVAPLNRGAGSRNPGTPSVCPCTSVPCWLVTSGHWQFSGQASAGKRLGTVKLTRRPTLSLSLLCFLLRPSLNQALRGTHRQPTGWQRVSHRAELAAVTETPPCCLLASKPGRRCPPLPWGLCQIFCNILKQPLKCQLTKFPWEMETL